MTAKPVHVRTATLGDYDVLVALFDELDEFHRQGRPDFFRSFDADLHALDAEFRQVSAIYKNAACARHASPTQVRRRRVRTCRIYFTAYEHD